MGKIKKQVTYMEAKRDKIVQSLYLCTTNSREKMQESIIENILYSLDSPLSKSELVSFIKSEFHLEIDKFELSESLEKLFAEKTLCVKDGKYNLTDDAKKKILYNVLENKNIEQSRTERIVDFVKSFDYQLNEKDTIEVANVFNEYIYDCFLEYGRNATKLFLPFKNKAGTNGNSLNERLDSIKNINQKRAFEQLVLSYSDNLTTKELDYLDNLAIKSEYFFSLGIPEDYFNKVQDFKLNGLTVLLDTNFIFSILGLHSHRQNDACNQITKLNLDQKIDYKLVFIRKTLKELQYTEKDLRRSISSDNLTYNQIKSLLDSHQLNNSSKDYFEKKLIDPDTPHPSEKIKHSQHILTSKKIQIYNFPFPHLEDKTYLDAKFGDYYDYLNIVNENRVKSNLNEILPKSDKNLEHDIYLREAVISLREKKGKSNELNFICITLDKGLIDFDRFMIKRSNEENDVITPNFILPSAFLRKIRPFIPIVTDDYKKAFISSITSNTIDTSLPQYSDAAQRSITYFNKLGIDDYDLITSIIKHELFFKEFIESEKENKEEDFIQSEINKAYEQLKIEKQKAKEELKIKEKKSTEDLENEKQRIRALENDISMAKSSFMQEKTKLTNEIDKTKKEKETLEKEKNLQTVDLKKKILKGKKESLSDLSKKKKPIEKQGEKAHSLYLLKYCLIVIVYYFGLAIAVWIIGWDKMSPIIYFLGAFGLIASILYSAILGKDINPKTHFEEKKKELVNLKYTEFEFNLERFKTLKKEIEDLETEITELEMEHKKHYPSSGLS